jgi:hypothetical protein
MPMKNEFGIFARLPKNSLTKSATSLFDSFRADHFLRQPPKKLSPFS